MRAFLFTLVLITFWLGASAYGQTVVQIAVPNYPPYCDENGDGLSCELYKAAYNAVGVEVRFTVIPIRRGLVQLLNNQVDAMAAADLFIHGPAQENTMSAPVFNALMSLFFYKSNLSLPDSVMSLGDLKDYKVGIITDSPYLELYTRHRLNVIPIETPEQLFLMVKRGRIDFAEADLLTGLHLIQKTAPTQADLFDYIRIGDVESTLTFHKNNPRAKELKEQFDAGFRRIWERGEYRQIVESFWGENNVPQAVFVHQYPVQGVDQPNTTQYWSQSRDATGKIHSPSPVSQ